MQHLNNIWKDSSKRIYPYESEQKRKYEQIAEDKIVNLSVRLWNEAGE